MKPQSTKTAATAKLVLPVANHDHTQGPMNAPFALVEYGDYECPYCGEAYSVVKAIQERLGDGLCFAFRNFPLVNAHPHAQHAAEAAMDLLVTRLDGHGGIIILDAAGRFGIAHNTPRMAWAFKTEGDEAAGIRI